MAAKVSVFVDENHDFIKKHCHMAAKAGVFVDENHDFIKYIVILLRLVCLLMRTHFIKYLSWCVCW